MTVRGIKPSGGRTKEQEGEAANFASRKSRLNSKLKEFEKSEVEMKIYKKISLNQKRLLQTPLIQKENIGGGGGKPKRIATTTTD